MEVTEEMEVMEALKELILEKVEGEVKVEMEVLVGMHQGYNLLIVKI